MFGVSFGPFGRDAAHMAATYDKAVDAASSEASPPRRAYLLFAGPHESPGGLRDFVGLFHDEATARRAFRAVRLSSEHRAAWAELGRVDSGGKLSLLCWFGHDRPARGQTALAAIDDLRPGPSRGRWRRWGGGRRWRDVPGR
jgi:hypothetical protein